MITKAQFLCVMNGGKLVQHCTGHAIGYTHAIAEKSRGDEDRMEYQITSTHHQMQCPYNLNRSHYDLLYTSADMRSDRYEGLRDNFKNSILLHGEPEIVLYHAPGKPKCLAIQGHPEMMPHDAPVCEMLRNLIDETMI